MVTKKLVCLFVSAQISNVERICADYEGAYPCDGKARKVKMTYKVCLTLSQPGLMTEPTLVEP